MSVLLVTSFNKMIYELSGVRLIQSYFQHKIGIDLLITYEGDNDFLNNVANKKSNIKYFNLNNYTYLSDWLNENEDIIPTKYGGKYQSHKLDSEIDIKLLNTFNSKMSLWFRKIASLKYALDTYRDIYDSIEISNALILIITVSYFLTFIGAVTSRALFGNFGLRYFLF